MTEWRWFALAASLAILAGIALHHMVGDDVDPFTGLAVMLLAQMAWRAYRQRKARVRRAVIELRAYEAAERLRRVASIESPEFQAAVSTALTEEGTERREGGSEIFPLPRGFRRRVTRKYWRLVATSAGALLVAAVLPSPDQLWRSLWLLIAVVFLLRLRRLARAYPALDAVIEINPYRLSYVRSDGQRLMIAFVNGAVCEDRPADRMLVVRAGSTMIPISYHVMGYHRLVELLEQYGGLTLSQLPPAG